MNVIQFIRSDYYRYTKRNASLLELTLQGLRARNHCYAYSFWLRLASAKNFLYPLAKYMHNRLSRKYGIQIPSSTQIGYGLYIGHGVGIIINSGTKIGNNCNISQFLSIGTNNNTPAVIGNNVYIGPHVSIVENVHIGNDVTIGAGTVVVKDVPNNTTVVGNPGKIIGINKHPGYCHNRYIIE